MSKRQWIVWGQKMKCASCGTEKEINGSLESWGWTYAGKFCCSYKCMRAMERKDPKSMLYLREKAKKEKKPAAEEPTAGQLGVRRDVGPVTEEEKDRIAEEYRTGMGLTAIKESHHLSYYALDQIFHERGVVARNKGRRPAASMEDVIVLRAAGNSIEETADKLGCCKSTVIRLTKLALMAGL